MDLEIITLSEISQRKTNITIPLICGTKKIIQRIVYKTETDSQIQKTTLWLPKGNEGRGKLGVWD